MDLWGESAGPGNANQGRDKRWEGPHNMTEEKAAWSSDGPTPPNHQHTSPLIHASWQRGMSLSLLRLYKCHHNNYHQSHDHFNPHHHWHNAVPLRLPPQEWLWRGVASKTHATWLKVGYALLLKQPKSCIAKAYLPQCLTITIISGIAKPRMQQQCPWKIVSGDLVFGGTLAQLEQVVTSGAEKWSQCRSKKKQHGTLRPVPKACDQTHADKVRQNMLMLMRKHW